MANDNNQMSQQRMGEIALMMLKMKFRDESLCMDPKKVMSSIADNAKKLNISTEEISQFAAIIFEELFTDILDVLKKS